MIWPLAVRYESKSTYSGLRQTNQHNATECATQKVSNRTSSTGAQTTLHSSVLSQRQAESVNTPALDATWQCAHMNSLLSP